MPKKKKGKKPEVEPQLVSELEDFRKKMKDIRDVVDDILNAVERGLKKLLG